VRTGECRARSSLSACCPVARQRDDHGLLVCSGMIMGSSPGAVQRGDHGFLACSGSAWGPAAQLVLVQRTHSGAYGGTPLCGMLSRTPVVVDLVAPTCRCPLPGRYPTAIQ
jgi:hypothetical protein